MINRLHTFKLRFALLLSTLLLAGGANAQENVEITDNYHWFLNGLYVKCINGYDFDRVAVVPRGTYRNSKGYTLPYPSYSGDVVVPTYVQDEYGNKMYVVSLQGSFGDCENLTSVKLSEGLEEINSAFTGCTKITSITIPNSVTNLLGPIFCGCTSLEEITLPAKITIIGDYQFRHCSSLKKVTMGNNMVEIGNSAFMGCSSLQSFIVPDGISTLPLATFRECTNLESITLPASISQIKSFVFYLCDKLKDVYCWATTPPSITDSSFSTYGTLHVPAGCKAAYESDEYWKNFTIVENVATHVQQVSAETSTTPRKVMKDGTVSIKVNGQEYDMTGKTRK